jgi:hypothetical protein
LFDARCGCGVYPADLHDVDDCLEAQADELAYEEERGRTPFKAFDAFQAHVDECMKCAVDTLYLRGRLKQEAR